MTYTSQVNTIFLVTWSLTKLVSVKNCFLTWDQSHLLDEEVVKKPFLYANTLILNF